MKRDFKTNFIKALDKEYDRNKLKDAEETFTMWSHYKPRMFLKLPLKWEDAFYYDPKVEVAFTSYRSDKKDGKYRDYVHRHNKPRPKIYTKKQSGLLYSKRFKEPQSLVILGFMLELEVLGMKQIKGKHSFLDWKHLKYPPFLCADPKQKNLLIIQPQNGASPLLIHSPVMRIRKEGITF